jgi:hypothetical protein
VTNPDIDDGFAAVLKQLNMWAYGALKREGWCSLNAMMQRTDAYELLDIRNFGVHSLAAAVVALEQVCGDAMPRWAILLKVVNESGRSSWWTGPYADAQSKLRDLDNRPRIIAAEKAVIAAAKTWHKHGDITTLQELETAIEALIEQEANR